MKGAHSTLLLRYTIILAMLLCSIPYAAAQIQVEYFWNVDNGIGKCARADATAAVGGELSFRISTEELSPGVHTLGIRAFVASDTASYFSPTVCSYVAKPHEAAISEIEYFWDEDPGFGKATKIDGLTAKQGESVSFRIPAADLAPGVHRLGIRAKDISWSPTEYRMVVASTVTEDYAQFIEYFWDEDPGFGKGMREPLQPNAEGNNVQFEISVAGLSDGIHTLHVRTKARGWSPLTSYLVRVENSEACLIDDIEYFWDKDPGYGMGIKVPFEQGSVADIMDFEPDIEGMTGDHLFCLRAHGSGGWSVIYSGAISFSVEGKYTLNEQLAPGTERNFLTMSEMFELFVERSVTADVEIAVRNGATFTYNATSADALGLLAGVAEDLEACDGKLKFTAANAATININTDEENFADMLKLVTRFDTENVSLMLNGEAYDFDELAYTIDELCPGAGSEPREWSKVNSNFIVEWSASARNGCKVTGYIAEGTGDLPSMDLKNSGTAADYIDYNVSFKKNGVEVLSLVYRIVVGHTLAGKNISFIYPTPNDKSPVDPGSTRIYWSNVPGAASYLAIIEDNDEENESVERDTIALAQTNFEIKVKTGHNYRYSVMACGKCDSTAFSTRSIVAFRTQEEDIAALKVLYNALGGNNWKKKWLFDAEVLSSANYPGVTFNAEGRVTAIKLENCNLSGELPAEGFVLTHLVSLELPKNNITGDVSAFVDECTSLKTLNMAYNRLSKLDAALPGNITSLNLSGQYRYHIGNIDELDSNEIHLDKNNISGIAASDIAWYNHAAGNFSAHPYFIVYDGSDTEFKKQIARMEYSGGFYKISSLYGDYALEQDADVLMLSYSHAAEYSLFPARLSYTLGDANIDALVDILDIQHSINYVAGANGAAGMFNRSAANTFEDETVNVQDIVATVNIVLDENVADKAASARRVTSYALDNEKADAYMSVCDGKVRVSASAEIAAMDILMTGVTESQVRPLLSKKKFSIMTKETGNGVRAVIFSLTGETIPAGVNELFEITADVVIDEAMASDIRANAMKIAIEDNGTTRIESITDVNDGNCMIFDLMGRRIEKITSPGIYVINGEKTLVK